LIPAPRPHIPNEGQPRASLCVGDSTGQFRQNRVFIGHKVLKKVSPAGDGKKKKGVKGSADLQMKIRRR